MHADFCLQTFDYLWSLNELHRRWEDTTLFPMLTIFSSRFPCALLDKNYPILLLQGVSQKELYCLANHSSNTNILHHFNFSLVEGKLMNLDFRVFQPNLTKWRESNVCYLKSDKSVKQSWWQISFCRRQMDTLYWMKKFLCSVAQKAFALLKLLHVLWLIYFPSFTVLFYFCSLAQIFLRQFLFFICLLFYPGRFF